MRDGPESARERWRLQRSGPAGGVPLLSLVGEVGRKLPRNGEIHRSFQEEIAPSVADILWYLANVAVKFGLDLEEIAAAKLANVRNWWLQSQTPSGPQSITSVRPKTGDFAVVRCRRRVFSRRILRRVGIFSKKSSPSRVEKAASRDVGGLRATPKRPTSRVGYQNRIRPRLRGHQTSSTASTRLANQTLSFSTLQ